MQYYVLQKDKNMRTTAKDHRKYPYVVLTSALRDDLNALSAK